MLDFVPLSFGVESLHPPMEFPAAQVREFYVGLADRCRFTEFKLLGDQRGAKMSESKNRHLTITNDRIVFRDEFSSQTFAMFSEDVEVVYQAIRNTFHIPVLLHVKVLVRLLLPYMGDGNTVEALHKAGLAGLHGALGHFDRPLSGIGLKVVFPPTQEHHSTFHLRAEPYYRDMKMFFLENDAQFFDPVTEPNQLQPRLQAAYEFLKTQAGPFVMAAQKTDSPGNA